MCPRASATPSCGHFSMQHHAVPEPQDTSSQKYGVMLGQCALPPRHVQQSHPATAGLHELPSQHRSRSSPKFSSGSSSNQGHASSAYLYRCMVCHTRWAPPIHSCHRRAGLAGPSLTARLTPDGRSRQAQVSNLSPCLVRFPWRAALAGHQV